eukprot:TRINITY_DN6544_c0_g1_i2.p1 TRINITY_DN6544_c0_g1~~TRINITY_DN6544_c0_g1_i2.p1  ORF type:complete len:117 (+),score=0.02 TRINITY_DN6544_c0_g1_i2:108-458(+)
MLPAIQTRSVATKNALKAPSTIALRMNLENTNSVQKAKDPVAMSASILRHLAASLVLLLLMRNVAFAMDSNTIPESKSAPPMNEDTIWAFPHRFPLNHDFGTLAGGLGCFPLHDGR